MDQLLRDMELQRTRMGAYHRQPIYCEVCAEVQGRPDLAPHVALTRQGTDDYWVVGNVAAITALITKLDVARFLLEAVLKTK